jgi:hypothetical protein
VCIAKNDCPRAIAQEKFGSFEFMGRAVSLSSKLQFPEAAMSKKGSRDKAEELRTDADNIRAEQCRAGFASKSTPITVSK